MSNSTSILQESLSLQSHLSFKKQQNPKKSHCNEDFLKCFQTHAQIFLLGTNQKRC